MMRLIQVLIPIVLIWLLIACATKEPQIIAKSLPESKLSEYNDSFSTFNEDLWELYATASEWQHDNFKLAETKIESGKLIIKTKKNAFSKASLHSKYYLRGDFDIQIDCSTDLRHEVIDMTQNLYFEVFTYKKNKSEISKGAWIELIRDPDEAKYKGNLSSGIYIGKKNHIKVFKKIDYFNGSFRLVRVKKKITAMYKEKNASDWITMNRYDYNSGDQFVSIAFANYFGIHKKIVSDRVLLGSFDNFTINAAENIIESEI